MKLICKKSIKRAFSILLIVVVFACCKREESAPEVKPFLKTNQAGVNTASDGVITMSGEFVLSGNYRSIQYGFQIDTDVSFKNPVIIPAGSDHQPVRFEATAQIALKPDVKYYVRTWAKTPKYEVLGNIIIFQSNGSQLPVIEKIVPATALWGDTIMILGKFFDYFGKDNKVLFNNELSPKIWGGKDTIWAIVPIVKDFEIKVYVKVNNNLSVKIASFQYATPVISGITKSAGLYPDTVTISGDNFTNLNTSVLVDGKEAQMLYTSRKLVSFIVPYLKDEKTVKVEFMRFAQSFTISDNFHYYGQSILGCSPANAWIGDTIKLYAKNTDFRRILLDIKNFDTGLWVTDPSLKITQIWNDSVAFILSGNYKNSKFNIDIQFGSKSLVWPYTTYMTIDQKIVNHRAPLLESIEKTEYVYAEPINFKAKGIYWDADMQALIKSMDGTVNLSLPSGIFSFNELLFPGEYQMQLSSFGRLSNIKLFTIKAPSIEAVSPLEFSRNDIIQITGKYLPYSSAYKFTQIESGRSFVLSNWWEQSVNPVSKQVTSEDIVGSGNYQLEYIIGDISFKYPGIIKVKDYFSYVSKMTDPFWQYNISCGFAINNKLYTRQDGKTSIIDISNGDVQVISNNSFSEYQPVFFNDKVYLMVAKDGKNVIGSFNETTEDWDALNMEGIATGHELSCFGVYNNHLIAITSNGDIYQYNQKWIFLNSVKTNHYFLHYIFSANGKLYLFDFYMGKISVVSTSDWKIINEITMPGTYEYQGRFIFEMQGKMYFCAKPGGGVEDQFSLYRFNPDETFEALSPKKLKFDNYYQFCPDGKGNVYFINERYVYKFNP